MAGTKKISPKHIAVVEAYLANGFKREAAVIAAGFSAKRARQTAHEIFKRPEVQSYLSERMKTLQMSSEEAMLRISGHASGDMRDFIGLTMDEIKRHPNAWLIKEISYDVAWPKATRKSPTSLASAEENKTTPDAIVYVDRIKLYDAQSALLAIIKQHQLTTGQPTENVNIPQLVELVQLLTAAGKDPTSVISRMVDKLKADAGQT